MEMIENIKEYLIKNIYLLLILVLIIGNVGLTIYTITNSGNKNDNVYEMIALGDEEREYVEEVTKILVDIKGMVQNPGLYEMYSNQNINDLIEAAGGLRSGGSTANINLSRRLSDQMVVIISRASDLRNTNIAREVNCSDYNIYNCIIDGERLAIVNNTNNNQPSNNVNNNQPNNSGNNNNTVSSMVSINNGTKEQLMTLSGIGESRAQAIITFRTNNGPFERLEDIMNVSGIGESIFANIKENITL